MTIYIAVGIIALILVIIIVIISKKVNARLVVKQRKELKAKVDQMLPDVTEALENISSKYNFAHYITESERIAIMDKYESLYKDLTSIIKNSEFNQIDAPDSFTRLHTALSDTVGFKKINNDKFINNQLVMYREYFDNVLSYPLDSQQREAIVSLEDNVLVISSAGSGKTMTTVGKVRYLIDKQGIDPDRILLITFTRKAAASLSERLGEKSLRCVTFHKLALDIIAETTGKKPSINDESFCVTVYHQLMDNNKEFHHAIADYILRSRYSMQSQFDFETMEDYMNSRKKYGVQAFYKDMDGRPVFCKSDEESQICDWLGERDIQFRYEEAYEHNTFDPDHRQYKPDFSIYITTKSGETRRLYLEHFAVNEQGHVPMWFGDGTDSSHQVAEANYLNGIKWKRNLHREQGTTLLETSSAHFHKGDVFNHLLDQLIKHGYVESPATHRNERISRELARQEGSILNMLTSFIFLLKSKGLDESGLDSLGIETRDLITINQVIRPFLVNYSRLQAESSQIDFVDAINMATEICNQGLIHEYDYILVDEFQDISLDRYKFLQALRSKSPLTKLFCVGDDWQSIYRFAGSDMALFKDFSKYFGYTKECRMETTYRFGEPLIQKSSDFILKNPDQKDKVVKPFKNNADTCLELVPVSDKDDTVNKVINLIDSIPEDKEVFILGRYSFNVNVFNNSPISIKSSANKVVLSYKGRKISYMTVHQSKGLECDYVILLGCDSGSMGFPAVIDDAPILKYVLSEPDGYQHGEERRVFYVAITRAKIVTYIVYNHENPSSFVYEFADIGQTSNKTNKDEIPEDLLCPRCRCGRIVEVRRGKAVNGNPYAFYVCSNERYGCDYRETRFVNLNRNYRKYK